MNTNHLKTLPESIGQLESLKTLDLYMNKLKTLPETVGNLQSIQTLYLSVNQLKTLPKSIGNLKSLKKLELKRNSLKYIPDSISELASLQILDLSENNLLNLPESIGSLKSLKVLDVARNKLMDLPDSIWKLENLKTFGLTKNPWQGEIKEIVATKYSSIQDYCHQRATLQIFISHAVVDFKYFRIKEVSKFLTEQEEIYQAYYCEEDLRGNIDDFMNETIPKCQLILFFASPKSVFDSIDCAHELEIALLHQIRVIPIKGKDIAWEDLSNLNLDEKDGFAFEDNDLSELCENLSKYIKHYKQEYKRKEKERRELESFKSKVRDFLSSEDFKEIFKNNLGRFKELFQNLSNKDINVNHYIYEIGQTLTQTQK